MSAKNDASLFQKSQLVRADSFAYHRDILEAVLDDGKTYTVKEAEAAIEKYLKGKVK